jgi:hypothetical protein
MGQPARDVLAPLAVNIGLVGVIFGLAWLSFRRQEL